jgi:hypothetical protein
VMSTSLLFCFILLGFSEFLLCGVFPYRD